MALKSRYVMGTKFVGEANSGTAGQVTIYSDKFSVRGAPVWSAHFEWVSAGSDLATAVTLWASNHESPDPSADTDWVQMTADYGYDGFFGGNPTGVAASGKDFVDVSNSGALWYKFKAARSAGSGFIKLIVTAKDS